MGIRRRCKLEDKSLGSPFGNKQIKKKPNTDHKDLCLKVGKWLKKHYGNQQIPNCPTTSIDMMTIESEIPDVIGWCSGRSVMIEVKVGRGDFLKDHKKPFRKNPKEGVGEQRFYCCPDGLIKVNEIPEDWGLLYLKNNKIEVIKVAKLQESNLKAERNMLLSIIRRKKN